MELPDFSTELSFVRLRKKMKAEADGQFQLFDSTQHVGYQELDRLMGQGLEISGQQIRTLKDETLAYKNRRIWLVSLKENDLFHLSTCRKIQAYRHSETPVLVGCSDTLDDSMQVCLDCLSLLRWDGMDARRLRRHEYAEQVQKQFDLNKFWSDYPQELD